MKRFILFVFSCWMGVLAHAISLNGVEYTIDTLSMFSAGPGATYYELRMLRADHKAGRLDCWLMTVDTRNPYVSIEQVMGKDAVIGVERPSAMAQRKTTETKIFYGGTNGDFFATKGDVGCPTGFTIINNEFAYVPNSHGARRLGAVDEKMLGAIGSVASFSAKAILGLDTMKIKRVNYTRGENELVLYNRHNAPTTLTNDYGTELLCELAEGDTWHTNCTVHAVVKSIAKNKGNTAIGDGQVVLSGHGTTAERLNAAKEGDTITIKMSFKIDGVNQNISQCIAGDNYALIVNNGQVEQSNFWNELHPRTAFGQSEKGDTILFLVVDGRGMSNGCTTKVLGEIIHYYGAYKAVNWDGGGSSCLYIRPFGEVNNGSDGSERAVANGMFAVANVPAADNTIAAIAPYMPIYSLPRYGVAAPKFLGYNRYGVLIDTDVQGVKLSCAPEVGEILSDGRFLASGENGGALHAALGGITTDLSVRLITSAPVAIRLDSVLCDDKHPYTVEVQSTIGNSTVSLLADALTWTSSDPSVATVSASGEVTGIKNGYAEVIGELGDFRDTILVHVEIPVAHTIMWDDFRAPDTWTLKCPSSYKPQWIVSENKDTPVDLQFTYKKDRERYIRLTKDSVLYSLPDTIRFVYATDALVDNFYLSIRANNELHAQNITITPVAEAGDEVVTNIAVKDYFGTDVAIYPLHMECINFSLKSSNIQGTHHLWLKGISLLYGTGEPSGVEQIALQPAVSAKVYRDGQLYIVRNGVWYNLLGTIIKQ